MAKNKTDKSENQLNNIITTHNSINRPNKLFKFIDNCLKPKQIEKKKYGEVFTPITLVDEILDSLDKYYIKENSRSIFSEKEFRWFDPANGIGNFPIVIYMRLMNGLKTVITDEKIRKKHILENMLYMSELNEKNVLISKQIFDINSEYKLNIYHGNSLELNTIQIWNIDKFDVIIGNPPYNVSGSKSSGNTLWQLFVKKFLDKIKDNKFLCFIHPPGWRKPCYEKSQLKNLFNILAKERQMLYLELHGIKDGKKIFQCNTKYDWYIVKNCKNLKKTVVKDENGIINKIDMNNWTWLPNSNIDIVQNLLTNSNNNNSLHVIMNSSYHATRDYVSDVKTAKFKYPLIHSTPKSGIRYMYSEFNNRGHFNVSKIIFGEAGINDVIIDYDGEYGMTQGAIAIKIDTYNEGVLLRECLLSDKFKKILDACCFGNYRIDWKLFSYLQRDFYKEFIKN
jgi:hypothetical protein